MNEHITYTVRNIYMRSWASEVCPTRYSALVYNVDSKHALTYVPMYSVVTSTIPNKHQRRGEGGMGWKSYNYDNSFHTLHLWHLAHEVRLTRICPNVINLQRQGSPWGAAHSDQSNLMLHLYPTALRMSCYPPYLPLTCRLSGSQVQVVDHSLCLLSRPSPSAPPTFVGFGISS